MSRIVIGIVFAFGLIQVAIATSGYFNNLKTEVTLKRQQNVEVTPL